ncbi:response regulator [Afifella sp. JA880]|uniref:response regulator n=1 Tax=Afifella sp. JA880 TaxID=2975280 RepID=UPI0021BAC62E|nr:response regulator [Afifella sp. JA880]MCT8266277.1 response regulator [Afifella sp. JA880]
MCDERKCEGLQGRKVLVVEDEYFIAHDLMEALEKTGARVAGPVPTLREAMSLLEANGIELAVLDINLQDDVVYPLADRLRADGIPVVFATGYSSVAIPEAYHDVPRWEKPFSATQLARALAGLA